ncbi:MAG TPA: diacylglycerol kinase family protein [Patescibacteria group bacterium]|nr:diacylglycerol kinase family protein [Patescibacteria group bacterium]
MYFYIYDSFLQEKKYKRTISKIETRLATLDISGSKRRLTALKSVQEIVRSLSKNESPTIVVIGNDQTFCKAATAMAGTDSVLGFIPVKKDSEMAKILGIPVNEYACDIVSARRVEKLKFGEVNGKKFFSSISFNASKTILKADQKYQIIPQKTKKIKIVNLDLLRFNKADESEDFKRIASNPKDDYLEILMGRPGKKFLFFKRKQELDSLFFVEKLEIKPKKSKHSVDINIDKGKDKIQAPATVNVSNQDISIIVGKDRLI